MSNHSSEEAKGAAVDLISTPNSGAAAARRSGPFSTSGMVKVDNPSATQRLYYAVGDVTVDVTGAADAQSYVPALDWLRINVSAGQYISVYAPSADFEVAIAEVL